MIAHIVDLVIESHDIISFFHWTSYHILCMKKCNMVFAGLSLFVETEKSIFNLMIFQCVFLCILIILLSCFVLFKSERFELTERERQSSLFFSIHRSRTKCDTNSSLQIFSGDHRELERKLQLFSLHFYANNFNFINL